MVTHLTVFLLVVKPDRRLFYSELAGTPAVPPPASGWRGRLDRLLRRMSERWQHPRGAAVRLCRRLWEWLHRQTHPDETLLARLRTAGSIELVHPAAMDGSTAAAAWRDFLARGRRRHWPWLVADTIVSPLTVLLAPLPGPNLIGYWFVYRAIHHLFILNGVRRVRGGRVDVLLRPDPALNSPIDSQADPAAVVASLAPLGCDATSLQEFLVRHGACAGSPEPTGGHAEAPASRHDW